LSHREQEILDEIAKGLAEQDPALVAGLARSRPSYAPGCRYGSTYGQWAPWSWLCSC
jgi:hypothetical protein